MIFNNIAKPLATGSFILVATVGLCLAQSMPAGSDLAIPVSAISAAQGSLKMFQLLHPAPNAPGGPPLLATTEEPVRNYFIRLDELKAWDGKSVAKLLHPTGEIIATIKRAGDVASAVTLAEKNGHWKWVAFGPPDEALVRSNVLQKMGNSAPGGSTPDVFQVTIPAMNAAFIAQESGDKVDLTPIKDVPELGIQAGKPEAADNLLRRIQPNALVVPGDKPG